MSKPNHQFIYLIPGNFDGSPCYLWSDDPTPSDDDRLEDAVKYIRYDLHASEVKQLQGNHKGLKDRVKLLHERPDMPVERIRAFKLVGELQAQLVAVQQSVVHGLCANSEPCSTFCEAIATRKMMRQLQVENAALRGWIAGGGEDPQKVSNLVAERDNAWRELREIREALKANPEESTADEVRALVKRCETLDSLMRSGEQRGEAKAKEELSIMAADAFGDGYFEGFIDGAKHQEKEQGNPDHLGDTALEASEVAESTKAQRLGLSPRKQKQESVPDFILEIHNHIKSNPFGLRSLNHYKERKLVEWLGSLIDKDGSL